MGGAQWTGRRWTKGLRVFAAARLGPVLFSIKVLAMLSLALLIIAIVSSGAWAQVGERNFFEPLITQDPNPSNTLDIIPNWVAIRRGTVVAVAFSLEKEISNDFSIELANGWNEPLCANGFACD